MSLTLATTEAISGVASAPSSITYTIFGDEIAAGVDAFKVLAQGQLPDSAAALYTVPASTQTIVKMIHLANVTAGPVTARLTIKGTTDAHVILPAISILAGGYAVLGDDGWKVYNDQGQILGVGATGATGPTGPGDIATDTIWDAAGDLAVGSGPDAAELLSVGDEDDVLTVVLGVPAWAPPAAGAADILDLPTAEMDDSLVLAPDGAGGVEFRAETGGGGGGGAAYLDTPALHGTYGDDFTAGPLDGKWTRRSLQSAYLEHFDAPSWLSAPLASPGEVATVMGWEETFSPTDEYDIVWCGSALAIQAADVMIGAGVYDSSGNGLYVALKSNDQLLAVRGLTAYADAGSLAYIQYVVARNPFEYGVKYWLQLVKRGTFYWARYSLNGFTWSPYTPATAAQTFTADRLAFGRMYGNTGAGAQFAHVRIDRINVENYLTRGNNLVRTPVGGTATLSASSTYGGFNLASSADGNYGTDWALNGNSDNPRYWQVAWSEGQSLNRVLLCTRTDAWGWGHLLFSDGSTVNFPQYLGGTTKLPIDFATKTGITSMRVLGDAIPGANPGFTEVEAYLAS